ncbi:MAG: Trk family potassium uptake protein [Treponema sp.]|nr:Trk family potassium uptake protein [Treponema sp.]
MLCLPIASKNREWTPYSQSFFTSANALCITGFLLYDTWTHWSFFGQLIILLLFQIGGIGFMTIITMFSVFIKRKIGLHERQLLLQSAGVLKLGGVVRLIKRVFAISLIIELAGACFLAIRFIPEMGFLDGAWNAIFHSVSAFCNAGYDLMGKYSEFSSLRLFVNDTLVNLTIIILIILGGIGFLVLDDIVIHKFKFRKFTLNSKLTLSVTGILILLGWVLFYLFEKDRAYVHLSENSKILASLFQSVTPRTAGFYTIEPSLLKDASIFLTIVLMFIGGSSGSTAGGIKTTTLIILVLNSLNSFRKTRSMVAFKRRLDDKTAKRAAAIVSIYVFAIVTATLLLCAMEPYSLKEALFDSVSALGTVGLSIGATATLSFMGKLVIVILMFAGRIGWVTLLLALVKKRIDPPMERPKEKILIG